MIQQHRRNIDLYRSKVKAEITTLENERTRVAADLHDDLGPLLFTVKFKISTVEASAEDQKALTEASSHLDDIIQRIREISNNLMPGTLLRKGVQFAIDELIDNLSKTSALRITFIHANISALPDESAINLYRIVQEIIHNTLKHAKASDLGIELKETGTSLTLITYDNGVGFDYLEKNTENSGLGLRNLLSRTELMNGDIYVDSKPGFGTRYTIEIPLLKLHKV
ncbi:MAG TPA: ATP-binding protein [Ferruginibacter sp.]|nr:ATP-binding protein [Ferruginibacter sp.]